MASQTIIVVADQVPTEAQLEKLDKANVVLVRQPQPAPMVMELVAPDPPPPLPEYPRKRSRNDPTHPRNAFRRR